MTYPHRQANRVRKRIVRAAVQPEIVPVAAAESVAEAHVAVVVVAAETDFCRDVAWLCIRILVSLGVVAS